MALRGWCEERDGTGREGGKCWIFRFGSLAWGFDAERLMVLLRGTAGREERRVLHVVLVGPGPADEEGLLVWSGDAVWCGCWGVTSGRT
jgi:hypothetical protein